MWQRSPEKVPALQPLNKYPCKQDVDFCGASSIMHSTFGLDPAIIAVVLRQQFSYLSLKWVRV